MGRRRGQDFEGLIVAIAILLFFFGAAIIAFLKSLLLVLLIVAAIGLVGLLVYRLGRYLWRRLLDVDEFLPTIDWSVPVVEKLDSDWIDIRYPDFPAKERLDPPHVIGTSGAWKDVLNGVRRFPWLECAGSPEDLQARIAACESAATKILQQAVEIADEKIRQKQSVLEEQLHQANQAESTLEARIRPHLDLLQSAVEVLSEGHFVDRIKANKLRSHLTRIEIELAHRRQEARARAQQHEKAYRSLLDPNQREGILRERIRQDLATMRETLTSKEFAGAVAELAVIKELSSLPESCVVFNDVNLQAGRYIHFEGKPLMSAQIDTLVITPAGVFVIEVKNWSRDFAQSGEGFNPYEQVSRAAYLVFDRLRDAGIPVKVRAIVASDGSLPAKGDQKVSVVPIRRIRSYIQGFQVEVVKVDAVKAVLGF